MILEQHYLGCLAQASYLIACERTKRAVVVDPRRDVDVYTDRARELGVVIERVLLTHYHADFVSGHLELAKQTGARIGLGSAVPPEYEADLFTDGTSIELGDVRIDVLHTPGHTPESVTYAVYDLAASTDVPHALLTGDALFIGDVGRPDLLASIGYTSEQLAELLYDSLHGKLLPFPDEVLVYPAHGAGSMCGKALSKETSSTLGEQRRTNYALQASSRQAFVELITAGQPEAPQYFAHDAVLNRKRRETLDETLARGLKPLELTEVLRRMNAGAVVLDVREADDYARGHLRGSLEVGLSGKFATWAGYAIPPDASIVLVGSREQVEEGAMRLGRIGLDRVVGFLDGGPQALDARPDLVASFERLDVSELERRLAASEPPFVLDVRTDGEFQGGAISGAHHLPLPNLEARMDEVSTDRDVVVVCGSGYRSGLGVSLLERAGYARLTDLAGGMGAWDRVHAMRAT